MADYISREAAIATVLDKPDMTPDEKAGVIVRLQALPAADVRPVVRGRWIKKGCYAVCSNCGERKAIAWPTTVEELVNVYRLKFCNNCGADMRGLPE